MKFQDPPKGGSIVLAKIIDAEVEELKKNPGKWALVREDADRNSAHAWIRRGCETTTRANGYAGTRADIYARWPA